MPPPDSNPHRVGGVYITNDAIYQKVLEIERGMIQMKTLVAAVSFVITPVLSVIASTVIGGMVSNG